MHANPFDSPRTKYKQGALKHTHRGLRRVRPRPRARGGVRQPVEPRGERPGGASAPFSMWRGGT